MSVQVDRFSAGPAAAVEKLNQYADAIEGLAIRVEELSQPVPSEPIYFVAKITRWATFQNNDNRWKYAWVETSLADDDSDQNLELRSGSVSENYAINLCEVNNSAADGTQGNSVDTSGDDFPEGFALQPVGGGSGGTPRNQVVVMMTLVGGPDGNPRPVFQYENAVDGTCE